jgi:predicted ATP-dependent endonuclease of OLD family
MHIRRVEIENIRSLKHLVWELPEGQSGAGWHVILGDNGSGKTSFVRAVASLCIDAQTPALSQFLFGSLTRVGCSEAEIQCSIVRHEAFDETNLKEMEIYKNSIRFLNKRKEGDSVEVHNGIKDGPWIKWIKGWFAFSFGSVRNIKGKKISENVFLKDFPTLRRHAYLSEGLCCITV